MESVKVGNLEVRGDLKASKKTLKKMFGKFLSSEQLTELKEKLDKKNDFHPIQSAIKEIRKRKEHRE